MIKKKVRKKIDIVGRSGGAGAKFKVSCGLPCAALLNCADNSGAKNLYVSTIYIYLYILLI